MPYDGSGNFNRTFPPGGWQGDATANIKIKSDRHDQHDSDLASGLSNAICRDGQSSITADIPFNGKKVINLGAPVGPNDAATKAYVDAIRTFSTGIIMSGAGNNNRLEYPAADMSFFVRSIGDPAVGDTKPRFVWNDKGDGTGTDIATLNDTGAMTLSGSMTVPTVTVGNAVLTGAASNGTLKASGALETTSGVIGTATTLLYFRPNGVDSTAGQAYLDGGGNWNMTGQVSASAGLFLADRQCIIYSGGPGRIFQFKNGWGFQWNEGNGDLIWTGGGPGAARWVGNGDYQIYGGTATKATGTTWANPSDARLKNVHGDYTLGLAEIVQVMPRQFSLRSDEAGTVHVGVIAQEIEPIFPQTVTPVEGEIDGVKVVDLLQFDASELIYALINSVKELKVLLDDANARIGALEAAP